MSVVYVSGPIKNVKNAQKNIDKYSDLLREHGHTVLAPKVQKESDIVEVMLQDLTMVSQCDVILMLPGFESSFGCRTEWELAHRTGKKIVYINSYNDLFCNVKRFEEIWQ